MNTKHIGTLAVAAVLAGGAVIALPALADTGVSVSAKLQSGMHGGWQNIRQDIGQAAARPAVVGKVTAVAGSTLTVQGIAPGMHEGERPASTTPQTTYTVDVSGATILKANATTTAAAISVGDEVIILGTVNGTKVTATAVRDGMIGMMKPGSGALADLQGNGEPVVAGKISAINGSTVTVGTAAGTSYTVDTSAARILEKGATTTASTLSVGDKVVIQGAVNGTSITASTVIDQSAKTSADHSGKPVPTPGNFFRGIGNFFKKLFGF